MHVIFHSLGGNVIRDSVESTEVIPAPLNCQYSSSRNVVFLYTGGTAGGRGGGHTPPQTARGAEGWGVWPGRGADAMLCSRYLHGHS